MNSSRAGRATLSQRAGPRTYGSDGTCGHLTPTSSALGFGHLVSPRGKTGRRSAASLPLRTWRDFKEQKTAPFPHHFCTAFHFAPGAARATAPKRKIENRAREPRSRPANTGDCCILRPGNRPRNRCRNGAVLVPARRRAVVALRNRTISAPPCILRPVQFQFRWPSRTPPSSVFAGKGRKPSCWRP